MQYDIRVNSQWILLARQAVVKFLADWPGGDPDEQAAMQCLKEDLDRLLLEVLYDH